MKFLLDENMPFALIESLIKKGHRADHVKKLGKTGIVNGEVYKLAMKLHAWLITRDKDFQSLEKFYRYDVPGIIVILDHDLKAHEIVKIISNFLKNHAELLTSKKLIEIRGDEVKVKE